jgi:molybdenum cofactor biosynthesis protein MoaC
MINITHKNKTHRIARALAIVRTSSSETIRAVKEKKVPKGDVYEMSKTAGLFAAKRTSDIIPDCHPLPIESMSVKFEIIDLAIHIEVEIQTVYKTGVEVEAMHAASVVALTIYDMLKPIDKAIVIEQIRLLEKSGGKSDLSFERNTDIKAAVIVCSDSVSQGVSEDSAGKALINKLGKLNVAVADHIIIPDEEEVIRQRVRALADSGFDLVILTGGTGLSPRDNTPEALSSILDKPIPGIEEAIRAYGQERTPYSMLSRSIAGLIGKTLVIALPGSVRGVEESMNAIFPSVLHVFDVVKGERHGK